MKLIASYFKNSNKKLYILIKQRSYIGAKSEMDFYKKISTLTVFFINLIVGVKVIKL